MKLKKGEVFKPKAGTILVEPLKRSVEVTTESGLIVNESATDYNSNYLKAKVIAVGEDFLNYNMEAKVGDIVLVSKKMIEFSDKFVVSGDKKFFQLEERDYFWGKVENE